MENYQSHERDGKLFRMCSTISFIMVVLCFLDIIFLGTGNLTRIGPVSSRMMFFGLAGLFSLPLLFKNLKVLLKQKYVICVILFMLCVVIGAVRGWLADNPSSIIRTDVTGYLNFCLLPTMLCVVNSERRKNILISVTIGSCAIMAVLAIILCYYTFIPNNGALYNWLNTNGICGITVMDGVTARVLLHTASRVFCVAFIFAVCFLYRSESRAKDILYICLMALFIVAIFLSYARAFYAGSAVSVFALIFLLLLYRDSRVKKVVFGVLTAGVLAVLIIVGIGASQKSNLIDIAIERVAFSFAVEDPINATEPTEITEPSPTTSESETQPSQMEKHEMTLEEHELAGMRIRQQKMHHLNQSIKQNPIFGNGLGAAIPVDDGYVEYTYHDILNKMGVVGLLIFLAPFVLMMKYVIQKRGQSNVRRSGIIEIGACSVMIYFLFIAYFNPCMNTTVGILNYLLCMVISSMENP